MGTVRGKIRRELLGLCGERGRGGQPKKGVTFPAEGYMNLEKNKGATELKKETGDVVGGHSGDETWGKNGMTPMEEVTMARAHE